MESPEAFRVLCEIERLLIKILAELKKQSERDAI